MIQVSESLLVARITGKEFPNDSTSTEGQEFVDASVFKVLNDDGSTAIHLRKVDNKQQYLSFAQQTFQDAKIVIVVYDITFNLSFEMAKVYVEDLKQANEEKSKQPSSKNTANWCKI